MIALLILFVVLLAATALFSGSETALFSLTRYEASQFRRDKRASHRLVASLLEQPHRLLLTLMIGNVTINMFLFATGLALSEHFAGRRAGMAAALGLVTPLLVTLFGDIIPKGIAIVLKIQLAPRLAPVIRKAPLILRPASALLNTVFIQPLTRLLVGGRRHEAYITVEELRELLEMSQHRRIINADETAMLTEVVQLSQLKVRNVMVPRVDMVTFEINGDPADLKRLMREKKFAKLPVYEQTVDNLLGLIHAKELFLNQHRPLRELIRPIQFVPEIITLNQLLAHFRQTHSQLAVAVDEFGGVVGLVTIEDVAEQIVGDLMLPGEVNEEPSWERLDARRFRVPGNMSVQDWSELFKVPQLDVPATTLAGVVITELGRLAEVGDEVRIGNLRLRVESLNRRRIEWLMLELTDPAQAPAGNGVEREGRR